MFRIFWGNLTKEQRIGVVVVSQILILILLVAVVRTVLGNRTYVEIEDDSTSVQNGELPDNAVNFVADNIWQVIKMNVPGVEENNIDDVVIRDGTYEEEIDDDGSTQATFIVDIDSLKQTYVISTGWSADKRTVYEVVVDCPPQSEMKYPETICYGMYNNTYSLDLYLPYAIYPDEAFDDDAEPTAPNYMITGDEEDRTLNIMVSACDAEKFKQDAMNYLKTTPIKLDEYTINYEINEINVRC